MLADQIAAARRRLASVPTWLRELLAADAKAMLECPICTGDHTSDYCTAEQAGEGRESAL